MSDVLIRDIPEDVLAEIDARAARLRLSRNEYLRRLLKQEARRQVWGVEVQDLERVRATFGDLADPEVMARAWS